MKSLVKINLVAITILALATWTLAATVVATPSQIPKGAYVNGGDGDQQFYQGLVISFDDDGAGTWLAGNDIVILFPADILLADMDANGNFLEEVSVSATHGNVVTWTVTTASTAGFTLDGAGAGAIEATSELLVFFPITTAANPSSGTADYTITYGTDDPEAQSTVTVTFVDTLTIVDFNDTYYDDGKKQSSLRGDVYPNINAAVVTALPDLIVEQTGAGNNTFVNGVSDWDMVTLNNADDDFVHPWVNVARQGEVAYRLWASQTPDLKKIDIQNGAIPLHDDDEFAVDEAVEGEITFRDQGNLADALFSGHHLAEGYWWFYVTSSLTADWVLGTSDTVEIQHHPVFYAGASNLGDDSAVDYDNDGVFAPQVGDDVSAITLESGGVLNTLGALAVAGINLGAVRVYWDFEDVDDDASVDVYYSTSSGLLSTDIVVSGSEPSEVVTALTGATKINSSTLTEEGDTNWVSWDIYTNSADYITAANYTIYIVTNDGKTQVLEKVSDYDVGGTITSVNVTVKHYPSISFQQVYSTPSGPSGGFDTAVDGYYIISWGASVDGDIDPDASPGATIKLYATTDNWATIFAGGATDAILSTTVTDVQTATASTLIATIVDTSDTRDANRYMWNVRDAGLAGAPTTYYIYGIITDGSDNLVVQVNTDGTYAAVAERDDTDLILTHTAYFLPRSPIGGAPVELGTGDQYEFRWDGFDKDGTVPQSLVQIFMAAKGTVIPSTTDYLTAAAYNTAPYVWLTPTANNGEDPTNNTTGAAVADGKITIDFATITSSMAAGAGDLVYSQEYEVYYFFKSDATFDGTEFVQKADGTIYLTGLVQSETDFELVPAKASLGVGDTLTVLVKAKDDGITDPRQMNIFIDVPEEYFEVLDQVSGTAGTQPFSNEIANFNGTELLNTLTLNGSTYELDLIERAAAPDALDLSLTVATIQLVVKKSPTGLGVLEQAVTFNTSGARETVLVNTDASEQANTFPVSDALTITLAKGGKIVGFVDLEGRDDETETVSIYVTATGSLTPITDSDYLSANGDADGTDGVEVTLGSGGYYSLDRVPTGTYDIRAHKDSYLDQIIEGVNIQPLNDSDVSFNGGNKLFGGDASGYDDDGLTSTPDVPDNRVDTDDITAISAAFGATAADTHWNVYADIDGDGTVYIPDLSITAKNDGVDGDGVFYKVTPMTGSNVNVIASLVREDLASEGVQYVVRLSKLAHLRAYAVELNINTADWEITGYTDGLAGYYRTATVAQTGGYKALYASAIYGQNVVRAGELELMSFSLTPRVANPEAPSLAMVSVVDGMGNVDEAVLRNGAGIPSAFSLGQNYPNPFNPVTAIDFNLPEDGMVKISVFNLLGQEVRTLKAGSMSAGSYQVVWNSQDNDGRKVSSGLYFYRLVVDRKVIATKKMILLQ